MLLHHAPPKHHSLCYGAAASPSDEVIVKPDTTQASQHLYLHQGKLVMLPFTHPCHNFLTAALHANLARSYENDHSLGGSWTTMRAVR